MSEDRQNVKQNDKQSDVSIEISDQQEEYKEWLAFAKTDYDSAEYLSGAPFYPRPLNVICYHCQDVYSLCRWRLRDGFLISRPHPIFSQRFMKRASA